MEIDYTYKIVMLIGTIIFVPSFFFQVYRIYTMGKHTINFSRSTWMMNYIGRYLWIIFGLFSGEEMIVIGQGLVALLTVPILYYVVRNIKNGGEYLKINFNRTLFFARICLAFLVLMTLILSELSIHHIIDLNPDSDILALVVSLMATIFTSIAFLPQGIKTIKNKNTKSTSLYLTLLFAIGNTLLVLALILKIVEVGEFAQNIGGILLPTISIGIMYIISYIKIVNVIKYREKV